MTTKRCCCTCVFADDDFNRADSTDIGSSWEEHVGDWEIVSGKLTIAEVGVIRRKSINPLNPDNHVVRAKIENYQDDTKYRILAQMSIDGSDYYYAEWHYVDASTMYFTIGDTGGALETIGPDTPPPEGTICEFTVTGKNHYCMQDNSSRITRCMPPKSGHYMGLAAGNANGATFDDFSASLHRSDRSVCPACDCDCDGWCIPDKLLATFQDAGYCSGLDGWELHLENTNPIKFGTGWNHTAEPCPANPGGVDDIRIKLVCDGAGDFSGLVLSFEEGAVIGGLFDYPDPDVSTCHPLSLRFGPFSFGNVSGCFPTTCCGDSPCAPDESLFYVWITPDPSDYDTETVAPSIFFLGPDDGGSGTLSLIYDLGS